MTKLDTTVVTKDDVSPFTTLPPQDHPGGQLPDGVTYVTADELRFLTEWNYGPDAHRETCPECGEDLVFEVHPGAWSSHPRPLIFDGEVELRDGTVIEPKTPIYLRVMVECRCGHKFATDGVDERDFSLLGRRQIQQQIADEVARRAAANADRLGAPVEILGWDNGVTHTDEGTPSAPVSGGDDAATGDSGSASTS